MKISTATNQLQSSITAIKSTLTRGACAMGANVFAMIWMHTPINFQYRNGTTFSTALKPYMLMVEFCVFIEVCCQLSFRAHKMLWRHSSEYRQTNSIGFHGSHIVAYKAIAASASAATF